MGMSAKISRYMIYHDIVYTGKCLHSSNLANQGIIDFHVFFIFTNSASVSYSLENKLHILYAHLLLNLCERPCYFPHYCFAILMFSIAP